MPAYARLLIGLFAALLAGWIAHGPLGQGEAFIGQLEARGAQVVRDAELPGVQVRFPRDPLSRQAILSGTANDFQREGQGLFPGINDRIRDLPGVSGLRWEDEQGAGGRVMPLILETELLVALAYLIGIGLGWLIFRPKRESYL
ncbi:MAG: hypothetical protein M3177_06650 [Pseudomonadota bacterium]|nr:hypothetical protein [Pseudomonadota bacterium]